MLDFSKMRWRLRDIHITELFTTHQDLFQLYNEVYFLLGRPDEPHKDLTQEQAVSLVVYTYHQSSPLVHTSSMHKRRKEALELLGFPLSTPDDFTNNNLVDYIIGSNNFINHLAIQLCTFEPNSFKWIELCRKQDMLDDVFVTLKQEIAGTDKKSANEILKIKLEIESKAEALQNRIQQLASEIFAGDANLLNLSAAHEIFEKRKPMITPERIAARARK